MDDLPPIESGQPRTASVTEGTPAGREVDQAKVQLFCEAIRAGLWKVDDTPIRYRRGLPEGNAG